MFKYKVILREVKRQDSGLYTIEEIASRDSETEVVGNERIPDEAAGMRLTEEFLNRMSIGGWDLVSFEISRESRTSAWYIFRRVEPAK
ncbi:MAG: hypothetical protein M0Q12_00800 [Synergistaceae bacterium]|jgi:hypothetical protein|nr:hypothetical protein [Synergistaceae bacterium]